MQKSSQTQWLPRSGARAVVGLGWYQVVGLGWYLMGIRVRSTETLLAVMHFALPLVLDVTFLPRRGEERATERKPPSQGIA